MNQTVLIILSLIAVAAMVGIVIYVKRRRAYKATLNRVPVKLPKTFPFKYDEPGMPYFASVVALSIQIRQKFTDGIEIQIRATKAKFPGWTQVRSAYDYNVMVINPDVLNMDGSPALIYQVKDEEGNVKQEIQTAGTVIGTGTDGIQPTNIVAPHQEAQNWAFLDYWMNTGRNESEHFAELFNDKAMFLQYATVSDIHPHHKLPEEETKAYFMALAGNQSCNFAGDVSGFKPQKGRGVK